MGVTQVTDVVSLQPLNTVLEVAAFCRVNESTVRRAIARGELDVLHAGRHIRITDEAVWKWLSQRGGNV